MVFSRPALGAVVALPLCCTTLCRASACRSLALTSWRPLLSVYFHRAVAASAWRISTTPHGNWSIIRIYQYRLSLVPEEIIAGDLNLHRELWDSHIYHQGLEAIISPLF
ncbi:hypothetical protein TcCL_Unassigned01984 [Trypanosoma cruzi]|nr:hypothetical protein TcCL_Unassigned01984 [Trypanosoma cruzi]